MVKKCQNRENNPCEFTVGLELVLRGSLDANFNENLQKMSDL
jgi:hypothetical protein